MSVLQADSILDAKGLACPMPIVKTKKAIASLHAGEVLEVQATDRGSKADLAAWAKSAGHQYLGTIEDRDFLKHYLRKSSGDEMLERKHPFVASNEDLSAKLHDPNIIILDVREHAEYAFNHIPNAVSMPLGELDERVHELDHSKEIYVVCQSGNRSDLASQQLTKKGFKHVLNVLPGMSKWSGETTSL